MNKKVGGILGGLIIVILCLFFCFYSTPVFDLVFGGDIGSDTTTQESEYVPVTGKGQAEKTAEPTSTPKPEKSAKPTETPQAEKTQEPATSELKFRSKKLLNQHYDKHGIEMGFESAEEYEKAAAAVVANPDTLHKIEKEDGDDVYYLESTNEFVIVSKDGYIRTYFLPSSGIKYYNKQ